MNMLHNEIAADELFAFSFLSEYTKATPGGAAFVFVLAMVYMETY
jgi:hypothetical protein